MRSTPGDSQQRPGLVLQHGVDGPPGRVEKWLRERGMRFVVHPAGDSPPPDPAHFAFLISLGSERSATASKPTWIPAELEALQAAVAAEVPVLGLCFGAQALSLVLGGSCEPLEQPEVGWFGIESHDPSVPTGPWLHYHFEQMSVPPGARELARSPAGPAVFRHGPHLAVQFHPEVDPAMVKRWAEMDAKLPQLGIAAEQLAADSARHAPGARDQAFRLFDGWLAAARRPK